MRTPLRSQSTGRVPPLSKEVRSQQKCSDYPLCRAAHPAARGAGSAVTSQGGSALRVGLRAAGRALLATGRIRVRALGRSLGRRSLRLDIETWRLDAGDELVRIGE